LEKRRSHPLLTEEDTIVVGDFTNSTGDPVFDDTLKQAVSIVLQQSPRVRILSDQKIRETLGLMERSPDAALNEATAREVCQRTGSSALLAGSISSLASQYVLGLKAVNCGDGDVLALEQAQAAKKEDVLRALDPMVTNLRSRLGESLASVQKFDTPLEQATTPSLEALKAYSLGVKAVTARSPMAGIPFVNRAIELDPNFALAYSLLGDVYGALLVESGLAAENMRKAYVLRDRVSERERFHIRQSTKIGLAMASTRDVRVVAALTLASAGDIGQAEKMAAELEKQNSSNTAISRHWLPTIRAYIAIKQRNPARALNALEPAAPYDLAFPPPQFEEGGLLYPAYVRGQAYLMLRRGKESAGEFQKLLDHRGILINSPLGALARLGLAHAFTLQGDSAKTRATYQDFLTVWKDADPGIPILKQAKAEYAKLQ